MSLVDVAALVISGVSVLIAAVSLLYARGQKNAAERSAAAAELSAASASQSAEASSKAARIEQDRRGDELAAAERNRVRWRFHQISKERYALENTGTDTAYGVHLDAGGAEVDRTVELNEFPPSHLEQYDILQTFAASTDTVAITWYHRADLSDDPQRKVFPV